MQTLTVLIMTPLKLEYEAMRKHLTERSMWVEDGAAYEKGRFQGKHYAYEVIIAEPGMKNTDMALATERAIQRFNPQIAILCGIAGGIKDVRIGDVAIAKSAFNYDAGKESDNGFLPRPAEYHFSDELLAYAQLVQRSDTWKQRTRDRAPEAQIHIASVAAGDKVVAAVNNTTFQRLEQYLSHCKFLEMEAAGFGLAVQRHRNVHALVVRGISDMCAGKGETDQAVENWQEVAAERASAVVGALLEELQNLSFITNDSSTMSAQALAQKIYDLLVPALLQNTPLSGNHQTIWEKIAPACSTALEKLKKAPENPDRQAGVRIALEDELEENGRLKTVIEEMVGKMPESAGTNVSESKNVVIGSTITAGGNVTVGDKTIHRAQGDTINGDKIEVHHHYGKDISIAPSLPVQEEASELSLSAEFRAKLRAHISKGRSEQALDELVAYTKHHPGLLQSEVLALSDRWKELSRKSRMFLVSNDEAILERNRIVAGLLRVLGG